MKKTAKAAKPATKAAKKTRHGQRAPGKTQTSISLSIVLLEWARKKAEHDGRSLSNWIELMFRDLRDADAPKAKR